MLPLPAPPQSALPALLPPSWAGPRPPRPTPTAEVSIPQGSLSPRWRGPKLCARMAGAAALSPTPGGPEDACRWRCPEHGDRAAELFCRRCRRCVCALCPVLGAHRGHPVGLALEEAAHVQVGTRAVRGAGGRAGSNGRGGACPGPRCQFPVRTWSPKAAQRSSRLSLSTCHSERETQAQGRAKASQGRSLTFGRGGFASENLEPRQVPHVPELVHYGRSTTLPLGWKKICL